MTARTVLYVSKVSGRQVLSYHAPACRDHLALAYKFQVKNAILPGSQLCCIAYRKCSAVTQNTTTLWT